MGREAAVQRNDRQKLKTVQHEQMNVYNVGVDDVENVAPLIAQFRVELRSYKGITSKADIEAAKGEFNDYIKSGYPIYAYKKDNEVAGYLVCRIDNEVVWVESLYVLKTHRKQGIATELFNAAEKLAISYGNDTLFNYVHPNNDNMISFLNKRGYNVLNLIEIRKKYKDENINEQIQIRKNVFDY